MLEFFDVSFDELKKNHVTELFRLRKKTFSDRLKWKVICNQEMEFDEFDNYKAKYILGVYKKQLICSVRFLRLSQPNMIASTFGSCFSDVFLPDNGVESSRFFVDKIRARKLLGEKYPVSRVLFLAMINWAQYHQYNGIYTIVSKAMLIILKRTGWQIRLIKEAYLEKQEKIYLVYLPAGKEDQINMAAGAMVSTVPSCISLFTWPLKLPV